MGITVEQMGVIIREQRKNRGLTQQDLANAAGVSVQAVSKWVVGQSLPDVTLLPDIADCLGLSLEALFGREADKDEQAAPMFPNDNTLRVAQLLGNRLLNVSGQAEDMTPIPLAVEAALKNGLSEDQMRRLNLHVEILGSARIEGAIYGDLSTGGRVLCSGDIQGDVNAGGGVECRGNIEGNVIAGGTLTCQGDIQGDAMAKGDLSCVGDIEGDASAGGNLICGGLEGDASTGKPGRA